jgi:transposase
VFSHVTDRLLRGNWFSPWHRLAVRRQPSLRKFLGCASDEESPDPSSLTTIRDRLPLEVHVAVFQRVLNLARDQKILHGQTLGVDSATLEANEAMKTTVRKETGESWQAYFTTLMREAGVSRTDDTPGSDDLQRFDKSRKDKKVSIAGWESPTDPDSRITKMKDGPTHLAYKAEHAVDLESIPARSRCKTPCTRPRAIC